MKLLYKKDPFADRKAFWMPCGPVFSAVLMKKRMKVAELIGKQKRE